MSELKGKIVRVKLNFDQEKPKGGSFKANALRVDHDGEEKTYTLSANSPAGKFVAKLDLKPGDDVIIVTGKNDAGYDTVLKVVKQGGFGGGGFKKDGARQYDSSGAIQGMVLNKAIDIALKVDNISVESIVNAAKLILEAKKVTDKLVSDHVAATKPAETEVKKKSADPFDEDEDEKPAKKKSKQDDFSDDDESPF